MSADEVEVEPAPAAEPEQTAEPASAEPRKRVPRPQRPDDTEIKAQVDALQQSIVKKKRRIEEIKEIIDARRSGKSKGSSEQQTIKNKLAELRGQFQALVAQKGQLRQQLDAASKARESARASMKELRGSMKFTKVEDIDTHIAELEHRISHDSLSLNEEKRVLEQIKALRKSRATIGELTSKVSQLEADSSAVDGLRDGIKGLDDAIDKIKAQEEVLRQELAELRAKEAERGSDIPALIQERDECREICKAAYQKIQDLRAELDAQWAAYKENNALFRAQLAEDRKARQEAYLKQRAERDAERAARLAEQAPEPFDKEVTLCDQLAAYLAKFVAAKEAAPAAAQRDLSGALEGFKPMAKKEIDDSDAWLLGAKKGKGKGKKEEKKAAAPERLVHSLDILDAFATLQLEVPLTSDKCPPLLEALASKKEEFLQRRKEAKERPAEPATEADQQNGAEEEAPEQDAPAPKPSKAKPAPPKLDDAASWPSIGGALAPAVPAAEEEAAAPEAEAEAEEEPEAGDVEVAEEEVVEAAAPAAAAPAAPNGSLVSVKLDVSLDGSVAVTLAA